MLGVQVNWTAPFAAAHPAKPYALNPLEALTSIAAALLWRHRGRRMVLHTDSRGLSFYLNTGLAAAYDDIDVSCIEAFESELTLDPARAPCVARMHVLGSLSEPFVAMDLDFVLLDAGNFTYHDMDLCCLHWELPMPPWYPPREQQFLPRGFVLPPGLDFAARVPNIAFLYVGRPDLFQGYAAYAVDYVTRTAAAAASPIPPNLAAIFAEQRLLGMLAERDGLRFETLWNDLWTCGPHGEHWEALARRPRPRSPEGVMGLVSPFWVLERGAFDQRKETVEAVHLWFEKPLFGCEDGHAPRRAAIVTDIVQRLRTELTCDPVAARLMEWLSEARLPQLDLVPGSRSSARASRPGTV